MIFVAECDDVSCSSATKTWNVAFITHVISLNYIFAQRVGVGCIKVRLFEYYGVMFAHDQSASQESACVNAALTAPAPSSFNCIIMIHQMK